MVLDYISMKLTIISYDFPMQILFFFQLFPTDALKTLLEDKWMSSLSILNTKFKLPQ